MIYNQCKMFKKVFFKYLRKLRQFFFQTVYSGLKKFIGLYTVFRYTNDP